MNAFPSGEVIWKVTASPGRNEDAPRVKVVPPVPEDGLVTRVPVPAPAPTPAIEPTPVVDVTSSDPMVDVTPPSVVVGLDDEVDLPPQPASAKAETTTHKPNWRRLNMATV